MNKSFDYLLRSKTDISINFNSVLRNTYMLLSLTVFFSAIVAFLSIKLNFGRVNIFLSIILLFGSLYLIHVFKNSALGLFFVFVFTGLTGLLIGPVVDLILYAKHGREIVGFSMFSTGCVFFLLSCYVLVSKRNFKFLTGFLFVGFVVTILLMCVSFFINFPLLYVVISGFVILLSCGFILHETSNIVNGGETNYILATISLYMSIFNIFSNLLFLLGFLSNDND